MPKNKNFISPAEALIPARPSLPSLKNAAAGCQACDLWKTGTQTVFGEGAKRVKVMFVGEQPGNEEDLSGRPFVGPAGRLLDDALEAAGIEAQTNLRHQCRQTFQMGAARQTPDPQETQFPGNRFLPSVA